MAPKPEKQKETDADAQDLTQGEANNLSEVIGALAQGKKTTDDMMKQLLTLLQEQQKQMAALSTPSSLSSPAKSAPDLDLTLIPKRDIPTLKPLGEKADILELAQWFLRLKRWIQMATGGPNNIYKLSWEAASKGYKAFRSTTEAARWGYRPNKAKLEDDDLRREAITLPFITEALPIQVVKDLDEFSTDSLNLTDIMFTLFRRHLPVNDSVYYRLMGSMGNPTSPPPQAMLQALKDWHMKYSLLHGLDLILDFNRMLCGLKQLIKNAPSRVHEAVHIKEREEKRTFDKINHDIVEEYYAFLTSLCLAAENEYKQNDPKPKQETNPVKEGRPTPRSNFTPDQSPPREPPLCRQFRDSGKCNFKSCRFRHVRFDSDVKPKPDPKALWVRSFNIKDNHFVLDSGANKMIIRPQGKADRA
eukprot:Selendium_serpulae@DN11427_c0_g1_i1.p1